MRERETAGGGFNHRLADGDRHCKVRVCVLEEEIEEDSVRYLASCWEALLQPVCMTEEVGADMGESEKE